jgi:GTP diphosphokinase / guanosine-3',5'-bis(diphosphate) 3'-diphosphatase
MSAAPTNTDYSFPRQKSDLIRRAFEFAKTIHRQQKRRTGDAYIVHPLEVANILTEMHMDEETIAAAILHDSVEDTDISSAVIEKKFGKHIAKLVQGVTKLDKLKFTGDKEEYSVENLRRMFLAMSEDIRVVMIKLADRLHNMRSLAYLPPDKQLKIARETLEIFAPIADRLCMGEFKGILEDLAFPYIYPEEYKWIKDHLTRAYADRRRATDKIQKLLRRELRLKKVRVLETHGRAKHLYSLYRKLLRNDMDVTRIYDLVAVRVIVPTVSDCYQTMGVIHQKWKPLPARIKDYIATPKPNGYRSLHTTVISQVNDEIVEIQIRTPQMHSQAEFGVAAHWHYELEKNTSRQAGHKAWQWFSNFKKTNYGKGSFQNLPWIKQITELQNQTRRSSDFLQSLRTDILRDRIIILTPQGHIRTLPAGSTPVDFAYSIHTDIGNSCIAAKINSELVPLHTKIQNGDIVKIITSRAAKGPKRQWLDFVATSNARNKILAWYRGIDQAANITYGQGVLEDTLSEQYELTLKKVKRDLDKAVKKMGYDKPEEIYSAIGRGELTAHQVLDQILPHRKSLRKEGLKVSPDITREAVIQGRGYLVKTAPCCRPEYGDPITGAQDGLVIYAHKHGCPELADIPPSRRYKVIWAEDLEKRQNHKLEIESYSRSGLLRDILDILAKKNIHIISFTLNKSETETSNPRARATMEVEIDTKKELLEALRSIRKIDGVITIEISKAKVPGFAV